MTAALRLALVLTMICAACTSTAPDEAPRVEAQVPVAPDSLEPSSTTGEEDEGECIRAPGKYDWLFIPSLEPVKQRPVNPRNSATRVHRSRERIVRVEIAHGQTYRPLFDLSEAGVEALRQTPDWPPLALRTDSRPASGTDWPVVFLIHVEGEALPYLGHPVDHELYFAEDHDPWHFYVWRDDGQFRDIFPMPFAEGVYEALVDKLGPADRSGRRSDQAFDARDEQCPPPLPPRPPRAFPKLPRALIEPADR